MEKVKPIIIRDSKNNREYTLEYDRDSIRFAESRGFKLEDIDSFVMTKVPEFFWYAFRMHHKSVALNQAEEILRQIGGMDDAIAKRLVALWIQTYDSIGNEETKNPDLSVEL